MHLCSLYAIVTCLEAELLFSRKPGPFHLALQSGNGCEAEYNSHFSHMKIEQCQSDDVAAQYVLNLLVKNAPGRLFMALYFSPFLKTGVKYASEYLGFCLASIKLERSLLQLGR